MKPETEHNAVDSKIFNQRCCVPFRVLFKTYNFRNGSVTCRSVPFWKIVRPLWDCKINNKLYYKCVTARTLQGSGLRALGSGLRALGSTHDSSPAASPHQVFCTNPSICLLIHPFLTKYSILKMKEPIMIHWHNWSAEQGR